VLTTPPLFLHWPVSCSVMVVANHTALPLLAVDCARARTHAHTHHTTPHHTTPHHTTPHHTTPHHTTHWLLTHRQTHTHTHTHAHTHTHTHTHTHWLHTHTHTHTHTRARAMPWPGTTRWSRVGTILTRAAGAQGSMDGSTQQSLASPTRYVVMARPTSPAVEFLTSHLACGSSLSRLQTRQLRVSTTCRICLSCKRSDLQSLATRGLQTREDRLESTPSQTRCRSLTRRTRWNPSSTLRFIRSAAAEQMLLHGACC
jgi:hypothetical protein